MNCAETEKSLGSRHKLSDETEGTGVQGNLCIGVTFDSTVLRSFWSAVENESEEGQDG